MCCHTIEHGPSSIESSPSPFLGINGVILLKNLVEISRACGDGENWVRTVIGREKCGIGSVGESSTQTHVECGMMRA